MHAMTTLGDDDARIAIEVIRLELVARGRTGVIAVVDAHGETIALLRMTGAPLSSINVASNKAYSAARLRRPSADVGRRVRHPEQGIDIAYYSDPRFIGFGGGLPVLVDGAVVGAVAVSGLSDAEDEELSALGIAAIMRASAGAPGTATG
jgi:glc operon protein GlcG